MQGVDFSATLRDTPILDNADNDDSENDDDDDAANDADNDAANINDWRFSFVFDDSCCNTQV